MSLMGLQDDVMIMLLGVLDGSHDSMTFMIRVMIIYDVQGLVNIRMIMA